MLFMPRYALPACNPSWPFTNPHFHQLFQVLRLRNTGYTPERALFDDGYGLAYEVDFLLRRKTEGRELVAVVHGLAANTGVAHVQGMMGSLYNAGFDIAGLNLPGSTKAGYASDKRYHFGYTDSLEHFITWAEEQKRWDRIHIVGFSLGGAILINYLADCRIPASVGYGIAISVPLDIEEFYSRIHQRQNRIYERAFILGMGWKELKAGKKGIIKKLASIKTLKEYDSVFTLPSTGYRTMEEYAAAFSAGPKLQRIRRPLLLLNARDDTFLGPESFPAGKELDSDYIYAAYPPMGSHCGFKQKFFSSRHFSEEIAAEFIKAPVYQTE